MFYQSNIVNHIRLKMNEAGTTKQPFLFAVNYEMTDGFFIDNPLFQTDVLFEIKGVGNLDKEALPQDSFHLISKPISYTDYAHKFGIIHEGLKRGDSFLTNLSIKTPIETDLSLEEIFNRSNAPYRICMPNHFVCFSPERFVQIENGRIVSNPMKGTIDGTIPHAEELILADFKETAEHHTIVDLIRNDLSIDSANVHVERFRYIDKIKAQEKEILQVSSQIEGDLPADYTTHLGDIIFNLLPAGSISGAPKEATVNLIREAEGEPRGYYTGIFGYFDGEKLDTGVLIRFIEKKGDQLFYRSGGGITAYSNCAEEYAEVLSKIYLPFT